jgi:hypothetical protein
MPGSAGDLQFGTGPSGKSFGDGSPAWNAPQHILRLFGVGAVARYKVSNDGELKANLSRPRTYKLSLFLSSNHLTVSSKKSDSTPWSHCFLISGVIR